jgi:hypothetical protein
MKRYLLIIGLSVAGCAAVLAGGSIGRAEIESLLQQKRDEWRAIEAEYQISPQAGATRFGNHWEHLGAMRCGPYEFAAKLHGSGGEPTHKIVVETDITFFDKAGRKLSSDAVTPRNAFRFSERITSILVSPYSAAELAVVSPDTEISSPTAAEPLQGEAFPETRRKLLPEAAVRSWTAEQLRDAINEMFARHGADFPKAAIKQRFSPLAWYRPRPGLEFDEIEAEFSEIEKVNLKLLGAERDRRRQPAVGAQPYAEALHVDFKAQTVGGVRMADTGPQLLKKLGTGRVKKTTELLEGEPHDVYVVTIGRNKVYRHWSGFSFKSPVIRTEDGLGVGKPVRDFEAVYGPAELMTDEGFSVWFGGVQNPLFIAKVTGAGNVFDSFRDFTVTEIRVPVR